MAADVHSAGSMWTGEGTGSAAAVFPDTVGVGAVVDSGPDESAGSIGVGAENDLCILAEIGAGCWGGGCR